MFGVNRRYILAALGIAALALAYAGYEQLQHVDQQPYADYKYQPARDRLALPPKDARVAAKSYQPYCNQPQSRDDADLCAQWASVQAIAENNRLTRASVLITGLEFAALVVSLIFTGWAARAAARSARAAELAVEGGDRPHLLLDTMELLLKEPDLEGNYLFTYSFTNHGRGPAWLKRWGAIFHSTDQDAPEIDVGKLKYIPVAWPVPPSVSWKTTKPMTISFPAESVAKVLAGTETFYIFCTVEYVDSDHRPHVNSFVLRYLTEDARWVPMESSLWRYS
jgi:hypothetical protein